MGALTRAGLACVVAATAAAQTPVLSIQGTSPSERLGASVAFVGDLDGDGHSDFVVGAPGSDVTHLDAGSVRLYSSRTGALLWRVEGTAASETFGLRVAPAGDVDGDGLPDVLGASTNASLVVSHSGVVRVLSGVDGSQLFEIAGTAPNDRFGASIDAVGDVDHDGHDDFLIGTYEPVAGVAYPGAIRLVSGFDASTLRIWNGEVSLGGSARATDDQDGDGTRDIVAVATSTTTAAIIRIFATGNGAIVQQFASGAATVVASIGDVDGDGRSDIVAAYGNAGTPGLGYHGRVSVLSTLSGAELFALNGGAWEFLGSSIGAAGDWNGDGRPDFYAGAPSASFAGLPGGEIRVLSGFDGALLARVSGSIASVEGLGSVLDSRADIDGDGRFDLVTGAPADDGIANDSGRARLVVSACPRPLAYCVAKTNSLGCSPSIGSSGRQSLGLGGDLVVTAANVLSNAPGILFWGTQRASIPFGGGTLCATGSPIVRTSVQGSGGTSGVLDCSGRYEFHFTAAYMASKGLIPGSKVCAQFYSRDNGFSAPNNIGLTDALEFLVCP